MVLVLLAAGAVLFERWRRSRRLVPEAATASAAPVVVDPAPTATPSSSWLNPRTPWRPSPSPEGTSVEGDVEGLGFNVIGPEEVPGLGQPLEPRLLDLLRYLAFHKHRHLRAGQILTGMWPSGSKRADLTDKTIRNYVGELRAVVGVEHLPEASAKAGYILLDVPTDTERFEALARQADVVGGEAADRLRDEALRLVRGVPFCDLVDEWIGAEGVATHMSEAIAALALRMAQDRYLAGDYLGAGDAVRRGIVGAPEDHSLWEAGAVAISRPGRQHRPAALAGRRGASSGPNRSRPHRNDTARPSRRVSPVVGAGEGGERPLGPLALHAHRVVGAPEGPGYLGERTLGHAAQGHDHHLADAEHPRGERGSQEARPTLQMLDLGCDHLELVVERHGFVFEPAQSGLLAHCPPDRLGQASDRTRATWFSSARDDLPGDREGDCLCGVGFGAEAHQTPAHGPQLGRQLSEEAEPRPVLAAGPATQAQHPR